MAHLDAEREAVAAGDAGKALRLSGQFHLEVARIADQAIIAEVLGGLVARSSLVIALYWQRRAALCESHAHDALARALAERDGARAEALMQGHLLDLVSSLDLRGRPSAPRTLREALAP